MRVRDWAGTVLVACLIAAAGLLRDHTLLLVALLAVALVCVVVILWDVRRGRPTASSGIRAGHGISAAGDISAASEIEAGHGIRAGGSILAGTGHLLPNALAGLYESGTRLREQVKPPQQVPFYRVAQRIFSYPLVAAQEQTRAQRWDEQVRDALAGAARRYVPDWDEAGSLPPSRIEMGIPMLTADARVVAAFMDAKLAVLLRIISELRDGK
ncbi:MAG: hypothetical protein H0X28_11480 [Solirubrobacterales bacterium]|nr:hypothetical protein [Solirubrobacterales bacterium]